MKKIFLTFASAVLLALQAGAQAPEQFNYQGVARSANGAPMANQSVNIKISILDGSATGSAEYVEKQSATTNVYGLYNIAIGAGTAITGTMAAVDWSSNDKYIKVELDPAGGSNYTVLGTTKLLSVPYAMYAAESNLTGAAGGDLSGTYPNPTIGSSKVTAAKIANGAVTAAKLNQMSATNGQVLKWNGTAWAPAADANTTTPSGTAGGDLSGTYPNPTIGTSKVTTAKIANGAVTAAKLNQMSATTGQVLKWSGTAWAPVSANSIGVTLDGAYRANTSNNSQRITANVGAVEIAGTDGLIIRGTLGQGTTITSYSTTTGNSKMFFNPKKAAFRAGNISNANWDNSNVGDYSFASGRNTKASGSNSTAMGYSTTASGDYSTAMGSNSTASGDDATAMGSGNSASGDYATAMGNFSTASGNYSTAMGYSSTASGNVATAIGGDNTASGSHSLAMGINNTASGSDAIALGGYNTASGIYSAAIGGIHSKAAGDYSTTIGSYITLSSTADGSMYLADHFRTTSAQTDSRTSANRFYARFDNGYYLYTDGTGNYGVTMAHQGNSWSTISDSTKKENYKAAPDFLGKIAQMKIGSWNYKGQDKTQYRHYGPYAQEFYYHFGQDGVGTVGNDTTIASADIDGVMMIAIQQLIKENQQLKADNAVLKADNTAIKASLESQQAATELRFSKLEALLNDSHYVQK